MIDYGLYHTTLELQSAFLDKTTGLQLQGGWVYFWSDLNRNQLKTVYELTGSPGAYTFTALPNPIVLSNAGTFMDNNGNDISVYYYPYDSAGLPENYYVQVFAAPPAPPPPFFPPPVGTPILTREFVPGVTASAGSTEIGPQSTENALSNPQFAQVYFNSSQGMMITYTAGVSNVDIAPGWTLHIDAANGGTITIARNAISGVSGFVTNPPYSLTITPGANLNSLILYQRLYNNPDIWSAPFYNPLGTGYIAASIALAPPSPAVAMYYAPSSGNSTQILTAQNTSGNWQNFTATNVLPIGANPNNGDTGYVDIQIVLATSGTTTFSSVQVLGLEQNIANVPFDQEPVNRQIDHLFHVYKPLLSYMPIESYLTGWDFPLNPAQALGTTVAAQATGAQTGYYAWDQTIIHQTATSSVATARGSDGSLQLTWAAAGQIAILQYLDGAQARKVLQDRSSVHISGYTNAAGGIAGNVTLWATTNMTLPVLTGGTNHTPITALSATGIPTMGNGTWTLVPNLYQNTSFTLNAASSTNSESADINLNGWDMQGAVPANTATFFCIVVGFGPWVTTNVININSISLCPGDIATRPSPKSFSQTLLDCQRYYWKTFPNATVPTTAAGVNTGYPLWGMYFTGGDNLFTSYYPVKMRISPNITYYNPISATNTVRDLTAGADCTTSAAAANSSDKLLTTNAVYMAGSAGDLLGVHIVADARLGLF